MKAKIITGLKISCLALMTTLGFLLTYSLVWVLLALPETWWAAALLAVLSDLSTMGLFYWIAKEA